MQPIDFYKLERSAQERFAGSVNGRGLPAPIFAVSPRPRAPLAWFGASAACFVLLLVFFGVGYGDLTSGLVKQGPAWLLVDIVLAGGTAFGILHGMALLEVHKSSPFRRGVYVFPVGLIDARKTVLELHPIEDLVGTFGPDARGVTLDFGGKSFSFPVSDVEAAEVAKAQLGGAHSAIGEAGAARESVRPKAMAALDPLQGYANPLASSDRMTPRKSQWGTFSWAITGLVGLVVGGSMWMIRNAKSDDAMFAQASLANDGPSYAAYLEKGTRHAAEVSSVLLPRALLQDAEKVGTVDAIEQFIKDHPEASIAAEANAALKAALLVELDVAVKVGTLAALDDFAKKHPAAHVDAELANARHGVYVAAFTRYTAVAPEKSPASLAFMQKLLTWAEKSGPKVEIRFHPLASKTMDKADSAVGKSRQFKGVVSMPSRYFDVAAEKADKDKLGAAIVTRFGAAFPPEILSLTVGDPITDPDAPLPPQITVPTMFIENGAVWAGSVQASQKPKGVFVGLELSFDAVFRLPDATPPLKVKVAGWHVPKVAAAADEDKPEDVIYAAMRAPAFDQFQTKLLGTFFAAGK